MEPWMLFLRTALPLESLEDGPSSNAVDRNRSKVTSSTRKSACDNSRVVVLGRSDECRVQALFRGLDFPLFLDHNNIDLPSPSPPNQRYYGHRFIKNSRAYGQRSSDPHAELGKRWKSYPKVCYCTSMPEISSFATALRRLRRSHEVDQWEANIKQTI
ncbi:hypothetical protein BJ546DRAFT_207967 [Cryomyces antarcticus]